MTNFSIKLLIFEFDGVKKKIRKWSPYLSRAIKRLTSPRNMLLFSVWILKNLSQFFCYPSHPSYSRRKKIDATFAKDIQCHKIRNRSGLYQQSWIFSPYFRDQASFADCTKVQVGSAFFDREKCISFFIIGVPRSRDCRSRTFFREQSSSTKIDPSPRRRIVPSFIF